MKKNVKVASYKIYNTFNEAFVDEPLCYVHLKMGLGSVIDKYGIISLLYESEVVQFSNLTKDYCYVFLYDNINNRLLKPIYCTTTKTKL